MVKGFKYFTGYNDAKKCRPLCIFHPKMSAYRKDFYETKYMCVCLYIHIYIYIYIYIYILTKDDESLEKYKGIWEKVKNSLKKESDSEQSKIMKR